MGVDNLLIFCYKTYAGTTIPQAAPKRQKLHIQRPAHTTPTARHHSTHDTSTQTPHSRRTHPHRNHRHIKTIRPPLRLATSPRLPSFSPLIIILLSYHLPKEPPHLPLQLNPRLRALPEIMWVGGPKLATFHLATPQQISTPAFH